LVAGVIANRLAEVIPGSLEESHVHGSTKLLEDLIRGELLRLAGLEGGQSVFGLLGPKTCRVRRVLDDAPPGGKAGRG